MSSTGTEGIPVDERPKPTGLCLGVRFTEDEARSISAQIDHIANPDAARRSRWERIEAGEARCPLSEGLAG